MFACVLSLTAGLLPVPVRDLQPARLYVVPPLHPMLSHLDYSSDSQIVKLHARISTRGRLSYLLGVYCHAL